MKKIILATAVSALVLSALSYADNTVSCAPYFRATTYSKAVNKSTKQTFFVKRSFHKGISNEKYIFPGGKVVRGQSRVIPGQSMCASYAKHWGKYVQYASYTISKETVGYDVYVTYKNGVKEKLHVYPMTKQEMKKAIS